MTSFCTSGLRCLYLTLLLFLYRPNAAGVMGKSLVFFNQQWPQGGAVKERGGLTSESEPDYIYIYNARERYRGLT